MPQQTSQYFSYNRRATTARAAGSAWIVDAAKTLLAWLVKWDDLARQRRALSRLDDRLLQDVGVTRAEAERESRSWSLPWWSRDRLF